MSGIDQSGKTELKSDVTVAHAMWAIENIDGPATATEVADLLDCEGHQARGRLVILHRTGLVDRHGRGTSGHPYRYTISEVCLCGKPADAPAVVGDDQPICEDCFQEAARDWLSDQKRRAN